MSWALAVESANSKADSLLSGVSSTYSRVTFTYGDPQQAEKLLNLILHEADEIIRQDQRHDVSARMAFLGREIPTVTVSDQRESLIALLSNQEQLQMMIEADKRFASSLIDPPYASQWPTSPGPIVGHVAIAIVLSVFVWAGLVFAAMRFEPVRRFIG
jgi:hypothetical protein